MWDLQVISAWFDSAFGRAKRTNLGERRVRAPLSPPVAAGERNHVMALLPALVLVFAAADVTTAEPSTTITVKTGQPLHDVNKMCLLRSTSDDLFTSLSSVRVLPI